MPGLLAVSLLVAVSAQVACQLYKVAAESVRRRRLELAPFVHTGGMPSAHSAFVTALTTSVGISAGFDSDVFAVAAVFSLIVIYDAYRLRGEVAKHATILNRLKGAPGLSEAFRAADGSAGAGPLNEAAGHSAAEIVAGIVVGAGWAVLVRQIILGGR